MFKYFAALYHGVAVGLWIINGVPDRIKYDSAKYGWSMWIAIAGGCVDIFAIVAAVMSQTSNNYEEAAQYLSVSEIQAELTNLPILSNLPNFPA